MSTILIVEDEPIILDNMAQILEISGFDTLQAVDGQEAWALLQSRLENQEPLPDLIVTDLMMPNLDGLGLIRLVKADTRMAHLPMLVLSARSEGSDIKNAFMNGATDYLVKPFDWEHLLQRIAHHLDRSQQQITKASGGGGVMCAQKSGLELWDKSSA